VALGAPSAATAALLAKKSATTGILGTPTSVLAGPPVVIAKKKNYGVIALVATLALMLGIAGAALVFMGDDSEDAVSAVEEDIAEDETIETHSNSEGPVSSGEMLSRLKEEPIADAVAGNKRKFHTIHLKTIDFQAIANP